MYRAHTNAWGSKFDLAVKEVSRQSSAIILAVFRPPAPDDLCKKYAQGLTWFWKKKYFFFKILPYMAMAAILVNGPQQF